MLGLPEGARGSRSLGCGACVVTVDSSDSTCLRILSVSAAGVDATEVPGKDARLLHVAARSADEVFLLVCSSETRAEEESTSASAVNAKGKKAQSGEQTKGPTKGRVGAELVLYRYGRAEPLQRVLSLLAEAEVQARALPSLGLLVALETDSLVARIVPVPKEQSPRAERIDASSSSSFALAGLLHSTSPARSIELLFAAPSAQPFLLTLGLLDRALGSLTLVGIPASASLPPVLVSRTLLSSRVTCSCATASAHCIGLADGSVHALDPRSLLVRMVAKHEGAVTALALLLPSSLGGPLALSGAADGTLCLTRAGTLSPHVGFLHYPCGGVLELAALESRSDRCVALMGDGALLLLVVSGDRLAVGLRLNASLEPCEMPAPATSDSLRRQGHFAAAAPREDSCRLASVGALLCVCTEGRELRTLDLTALLGEGAAAEERPVERRTAAAGGRLRGTSTRALSAHIQTLGQQR